MKSGMKTIQSQCQRHDCYYLEALQAVLEMAGVRGK